MVQLESNSIKIVLFSPILTFIWTLNGGRTPGGGGEGAVKQSIRPEMNRNLFNIGNQIKCEMECKEAQDNAHILTCVKTNQNINILNMKTNKMVHLLEDQSIKNIPRTDAENPILNTKSQTPSAKFLAFN